MKVQLSILWLIYLLGAFSACAQSNSNQAVKPAPYLKFDQVEFNFGMVDEGTLVKHVFKFKNTGEDTLHIIRVEPG